MHISAPPDGRAGVTADLVSRLEGETADPAAATEHRRIVTDVLSDHLAHA
ncbi:hypothetical protein AB0K12_29045 [Nonomuraea sp. NPDC049419]